MVREYHVIFWVYSALVAPLWISENEKRTKLLQNMFF